MSAFDRTVDVLAGGAPNSQLVQEYAAALHRKRPRQRWSQLESADPHAAQVMSGVYRVALSEAKAGGVVTEAGRREHRRLQRACHLLPPAPTKHAEGREPVPYVLQGDLRFYSVQFLLRRHRLRRAPRVRACLSLWFAVARTCTEDGRAVLGVGRETYLSIFTTLWPVLNPSGSTAEGLVLAELDWERDVALGRGRGPTSTSGSASPTRRRDISKDSDSGVSGVSNLFLKERVFADTMFELADVWTETTAEKEYCQFLLTMLRHWVDSVGRSELPTLLQLASDTSEPSAVDAVAARDVLSGLGLWVWTAGPQPGTHWRHSALPEVLAGLPEGLPEGGDGDGQALDRVGAYDSDSDALLSTDESDSGVSSAGSQSSSGSFVPGWEGEGGDEEGHLAHLLEWAARKGYAPSHSSFLRRHRSASPGTVVSLPTHAPTIGRATPPSDASEVAQRSASQQAARGRPHLRLHLAADDNSETSDASRTPLAGPFLRAMDTAVTRLLQGKGADHAAKHHPHPKQLVTAGGQARGVGATMGGAPHAVGQLLLPTARGSHPGLSVAGSVGGNYRAVHGQWVGGSTSGSVPHRVPISTSGGDGFSSGVLAASLHSALTSGVWQVAGVDGTALATRAWDGELLLAMAEVEARRRERAAWQRAVSQRVVAIWKEMVLRTRARRAHRALLRTSSKARRKERVRRKFMKALQSVAAELKDAHASRLMGVLDTLPSVETSAAQTGAKESGEGKAPPAPPGRHAGQPPRHTRSRTAPALPSALRTSHSTTLRKEVSYASDVEDGEDNADAEVQPASASVGTEYDPEHGAVIHGPTGNIFIPPLPSDTHALFAAFRDEEGYSHEMALCDHLLLSGLGHRAIAQAPPPPARTTPRSTSVSVAEAPMPSAGHRHTPSMASVGLPAVSLAVHRGGSMQFDALGRMSSLSSASSEDGTQRHAEHPMRLAATPQSSEPTAASDAQAMLYEVALAVAKPGAVEAFPRQQKLQGEMAQVPSPPPSRHRSRVTFSDRALAGVLEQVGGVDAAEQLHAVSGLEQAAAAKGVSSIVNALQGSSEGKAGAETATAAFLSRFTAMKRMAQDQAAAARSRLAAAKARVAAPKVRMLLNDDTVMRAAAHLQSKAVHGFTSPLSSASDRGSRSGHHGSSLSMGAAGSKSLLSTPSALSMGAEHGAPPPMLSGPGTMRPVRYGVGGLGCTPRDWELLGVMPIQIPHSALQHAGLVRGVGSSPWAGSGGVHAAGVVFAEALALSSSAFAPAAPGSALGGLVQAGMQATRARLEASPGAPLYVGAASEGWVWVAWMLVDHLEGAHVPRRKVTTSQTRRGSHAPSAASAPPPSSTRATARTPREAVGVDDEPSMQSTDLSATPVATDDLQTTSFWPPTPSMRQRSSSATPRTGSPRPPTSRAAKLDASVVGTVDDLDALSERRSRVNADGTTWSRADAAEDASREIVLGVFPDQLTAALVFDHAVRERRARLGIPAPIAASLQDQLGRDAGDGRSAGGGAVDGLSAWDIRRLPARSRHNLFTNFTLAGMLLKPPPHLHAERAFFPPSAAPPRLHRWQVYTHLAQQRALAAATTADAAASAARRFGLQHAQSTAALQAVQSAVQAGQLHCPAVQGGSEGVQASMQRAMAAASGEGDSRHDHTAKHQALVVPDSIPVGAGIQSPLPAQLTQREAGWVEGDNTLLRYGLAATAKDVAGMDAEVLATAPRPAAKVAVAEGPLRASDLLHTPLLMAMMRADRARRRKRLHAALLKRTGIQLVESPSLEEEEGGASDSEEAEEDEDEVAFATLDQDLLVSMLAAGEEEAAAEYQRRFNAHQQRVSAADEKAKAASARRRAAAKRAREEALQRSRAEMERKKALVKSRWQEMRSQREARSAVAAKGMEGNASDILRKVSQSAQWTLASAGGEREAQARKPFRGGGFGIGGRDMENAQREMSEDGDGPLLRARELPPDGRRGVSHSPRFGRLDELDARGMLGPDLPPGTPPHGKRGPPAPTIPREAPDSPLHGSRTLHGQGDMPPLGDGRLTGVGGYTVGQAPELGKGGNWVDPGAGRAHHALVKARAAPSGSSAHRLTSKQEAGVSRLASGVAARDPKVKRELQRKFAASKRQMERLARRKRAKRSTRTKEFSFATRARPARRPAPKPATPQPATKPRRRPYTPPTFTDDSSEGVDTGGLSDWEGRYLRAQSQRLAAMAVRRGKARGQDVSRFAAPPTSPSAEGKGGEEGDVSYLQAAAARRARRRVAELQHGKGGLTLEQWWAQLTALATLNARHERHSSAEAFFLGDLNLEGDKAATALQVAVRTAARTVRDLTRRGKIPHRRRRRRPPPGQAPPQARLASELLSAAMASRGGVWQDVSLPTSPGGGEGSGSDVLTDLSDSSASSGAFSEAASSGRRSRSYTGRGSPGSPGSPQPEGALEEWTDLVAPEQVGEVDAIVRRRSLSAATAPRRGDVPPPSVVLSTIVSQEGTGPTPDSGALTHSDSLHASSMVAHPAVPAAPPSTSKEGLELELSDSDQEDGGEQGAFSEGFSFDAEEVAQAEAWRSGRAAPATPLPGDGDSDRDEAHRHVRDSEPVQDVRVRIAHGLSALATSGPRRLARTVGTLARRSGWFRAAVGLALPQGSGRQRRRAQAACKAGAVAVAQDDTLAELAGRHAVSRMPGGATPRGLAELAAPGCKLPDWVTATTGSGTALHLPEPWLLHHTSAGQAAFSAVKVLAAGAGQAAALAAGDVSRLPLALRDPGRVEGVPASVLARCLAGGGVRCRPLRNGISLRRRAGTRSGGMSWSDSEVDKVHAAQRRSARGSSIAGAHRHLSHRSQRQWLRRWLSQYGKLCAALTPVWEHPTVGGTLRGGAHPQRRSLSDAGVTSTGLAEAGDTARTLSSASSVMGGAVWGEGGLRSQQWGVLSQQALRRLATEQGGRASLDSVHVAAVRPKVMHWGGGLIDAAPPDRDSPLGTPTQAGPGVTFRTPLTTRQRTPKAATLRFGSAVAGGPGEAQGELRGSVGLVSPALSMRSRRVVAAARSVARHASSTRAHTASLLAISGPGQVEQRRVDVPGTVSLGALGNMPVANMPTAPPTPSATGPANSVTVMAGGGSSTGTVLSERAPSTGSPSRRTAGRLADSPWRRDPAQVLQDQRVAFADYMRDMVGMGLAPRVVRAPAGIPGPTASRHRSTAGRRVATPSPLQAWHKARRMASHQAPSIAAEQLLALLGGASPSSARQRGSSPSRALMGGGFAVGAKGGRGTLHRGLVFSQEHSSSATALADVARAYPTLLSSLLSAVQATSLQLALGTAPGYVRAAVRDASVIRAMRTLLPDPHSHRAPPPLQGTVAALLRAAAAGKASHRAGELHAWSAELAGEAGASLLGAFDAEAGGWMPQHPFDLAVQGMASAQPGQRGVRAAKAQPGPARSVLRMTNVVVRDVAALSSGRQSDARRAEQEQPHSPAARSPSPDEPSVPDVVQRLSGVVGRTRRPRRPMHASDSAESLHSDSFTQEALQSVAVAAHGERFASATSLEFEDSVVPVQLSASAAQRGGSRWAAAGAAKHSPRVPGLGGGAADLSQLSADHGAVPPRGTSHAPTQGAVEASVQVPSSVPRLALPSRPGRKLTASGHAASSSAVDSVRVPFLPPTTGRSHSEQDAASVASSAASAATLPLPGTAARPLDPDAALQRALGRSDAALLRVASAAGLTGGTLATFRVKLRPAEYMRRRRPKGGRRRRRRGRRAQHPKVTSTPQDEPAESSDASKGGAASGAEHPATAHEPSLPQEPGSMAHLPADMRRPDSLADVMSPGTPRSIVKRGASGQSLPVRFTGAPSVVSARSDPAADEAELDAYMDAVLAGELDAE